MAVEFNDKSFSITIYTGMNPIEEWLELHNELTDVLSMLDMVSISMPTPYRVLELIKEMMPDVDTAKKMVSNEHLSI